MDGVTVAVDPRDSVRDVGLGLALLGGLILIMSVVWIVSCQGGTIGPCIGTPFMGRQGFLEGLGGVLLVVGLVLVAAGRRHLAAPLPPERQSA
jgi:predicted tellurium resistance membrane protein TerC